MDLILWISSKLETIFFVMDFQRNLKNYNILHGRRWKIFFRPISYPLYHRGSKTTNLTSVPFCKGRSVAPARCDTGAQARKYLWGKYFILSDNITLVSPHCPSTSDILHLQTGTMGATQNGSLCLQGRLKKLPTAYLHWTLMYQQWIIYRGGNAGGRG